VNLLRDSHRDLVAVRRRTHEILDSAQPGDRASQFADIVILMLIVANVAAVVFDTVGSIHEAIGPQLLAFEYFSVAVFSIEYLLRLWSAPEGQRTRRPVVARTHWALSWFGIIDLLAILPTYLPMLIPIDLRTLRLLRLFRLGRLLKVGRYSRAFRTFGLVMRTKREELTIAVAAVLVLLLISSSLMYFVENEAQPDVFTSIPAAMWWGAAALTTVGYGDVYPVTVLGKVLGVLSAILGIGLFALPAGILASGFSDALACTCRDDGICPTCGQQRSES
jgi:voltage-gated potassium channel